MSAEAEPAVPSGSRRRRTTALALGLTTAVVGGGVAASQITRPDTVCVNEKTQQRVDDQQCRSGRSGVGFYSYRRPWYKKSPAVNSPLNTNRLRTTTGQPSKFSSPSAPDSPSNPVKRGGFGDHGSGGSS